jgi:ABC-type sugar transport system ATPase subunit
MSNTTTVYVTHDYQEALALGDRIAILRDGQLVQVDTPEAIWRRPADTFVAKALGQPEINIVEAIVDQGVLRVPGSGIDIPVPADFGFGTSSRVRLGIRPCDIEVAERASSAPGLANLPGTITLTERLGRNVEVSVDVGGTSLIALSPGGPHIREGAGVVVTVPLADVHIFEPGEPGSDSRRLGAAAVKSQERQ